VPLNTSTHSGKAGFGGTGAVCAVPLPTLALPQAAIACAIVVPEFMDAGLHFGTLLTFSLMSSSIHSWTRSVEPPAGLFPGSAKTVLVPSVSAPLWNFFFGTFLGAKLNFTPETLPSDAVLARAKLPVATAPAAARARTTAVRLLMRFN